MHARKKSISALLALVFIAVHSPMGAAETGLNAELTASQIVDKVLAVPESPQVRRNLTMQLIDKRGKKRERITSIYKRNYADSSRTLLYYTAPANIKNTGFLIWDYDEAGIDDLQWLYLPSLRKARRISSADRGDYFLGTDFTYEDIKLDGKLEPLDYDFELLGMQREDGLEIYHLKSVPKSDEIAKELGYSRVDVWVSSREWMIRKSDFWDTKGVLLKSLEVSKITQIEGIWSRMNLTMKNHKSGHKTHFVFSEVDYNSPIDDQYFTRSALVRGL
ncbi:MAG: outer membrane lipoprotein-sorting protein [Halioglobus sp.]|jgi:outer membrane lipoprotein-sorting protein